MGAEWPHGLALAGDAGPADLAQSLGLYQRESHLPVRQGVLGQVNSLLTALAAEPLDLVTVVAKGGGWCICRSRSSRYWRWPGGRLRTFLACSGEERFFRHSDKGFGISLVRGEA